MISQNNKHFSFQVEYIDDVWRRLTRHRTGPRADNVIVNNSTISCREVTKNLPESNFLVLVSGFTSSVTGGWSGVA